MPDSRESEHTGDPSRWPPEAVDIARRFHETYEQLAPSLGYRTRLDSAVPWAEVPQKNQLLMVQVVSVLLLEGVIRKAEDPEADDQSMGTERRWIG